ncbi:MAG: inositol 2-dehydrogenase [Acidobacteriota bacterium]|nr:inositol 2-dehydrogenase [Acidobacteriota bacterium]
MVAQLNLGLIGAGRIGLIHAHNLTRRIPEARLSVVVDISLKAAERCAAEFGIPASTPETARIMEDPSIDAVVICSSTPTHPELIREAAAAGKHIFCEKPLALDLQQIDDALEAVREFEVKLQVGFNRRFDPSFHQAREAVAAGRIGTPHLVRVTSRDPEPPPAEYVKASGGIFLDMTIHDFDIAGYLAGDEIEELYATGSTLIDPAIGQAGDLDTAMVMLRFAGGALGAIDNSRRAVYGYDQRVEVFGSEGQVVVGNRTSHQAVYSNGQGVQGPLPLYFFLERYQESYLAEMKAFVVSVLEDSKPPVTGRAGRRAVELGLAAWRSYRENRPVSVGNPG